MVNNYLFKDRDGQTPLPAELRKGLIPKTVNTMGDLDEREEANIAKGLVWVFQQNLVKILISSFWIKTHKELFKDVWRWAGDIRDHELQNEEFKMPHQIRTELKKLEDDLQYWIENDTFADKRELLARFHERLLTIHPFANGNGRTSRILTEALARYLGTPIPTWGAKYQDKKKIRRSMYIDSVKEMRRAKKAERLVSFMFS